MGYKSYRKEVDKKMDKAITDSLEAVGLQAQRNVTLKIKQNRQVDTGRMRASVTYVTGDKRGNINADLSGVLHGGDKPKGILPKNTLHIGTNVKYAIWQEKINPFLKPAIINFKKQYVKLFQSVFERVMK